MATSFELNFKRIALIPKDTKYTTYGYIRECEKLLPEHEDNPYYVTPELVYFLVLLFFDEPEYFTINKSRIFNYDYLEYGKYYHIYGNKRIERKHTQIYQWKVKVSDAFVGRIGILNDIPWTYDNINDQQCYWKNREIICVGADDSSGHIFGNIYDPSLDSFMEIGDTVIITVDFMKNTVTFKSTKRQSREAVRKLKDGIDAIKFCAECTWSDSTIELV